MKCLNLSQPKQQGYNNNIEQHLSKTQTTHIQQKNIIEEQKTKVK